MTKTFQVPSLVEEQHNEPTDPEVENPLHPPLNANVLTVLTPLLHPISIGLPKCWICEFVNVVS